MQPFPHLQIASRAHLSFVGQKTHKTSFMSNKNRPGRSEEHTEALDINKDFVPTPKPEPIAEAPATEFAPEATTIA